MPVERRHESESITLTTSVATTPEIDLRWYSAAAVTVPAGCTQFTYYGAPAPGGTYVQIGNVGSGGDGTDAVTAATLHVLPDELFPVLMLKIVASTGGAAVVHKKS